MIQRPTFQVPSAVYFGENLSATLGDHVAALGAQMTLVITDRGVREAGIVDQVTASLRERGQLFEVFDAISPNPRDTECIAGAELARDLNAGAVIAIGGGSPIDAAKAIAGLATNGGTPQDWEAPKTFIQPPLPIITMPTTAGTGSEVTRSSVITDSNRHFKMSLRDIRLAPTVSLVDPVLTYSLPASITAATGMDALTHAVEAYTCQVANPVSDAMAMRAIHLISQHLVAAVQDGTNQEARHGMMLASLLAGMAFGNADVASVHCLAEALGGRYDTPHGVANSIFLPYVFAYNAEVESERHAEIASILGAELDGLSAVEAAHEGGGVLKALAVAIGIPRFRDLPGIDPADFPAIAQASQINLSTPSNARPIDAEQYERLLWLAWED